MLLRFHAVELTTRRQTVWPEYMACLEVDPLDAFDDEVAEDGSSGGPRRR